MNEISKYLTAKFTSKFAEGVLVISLPIYLAIIGTDIKTIGLFFAVLVIIDIVLSPIIGVLVNGLSNRKIMVVGDVFSCIILIITYMFSLYENIIGLLVIVSVIKIANIFIGIASSVYVSHNFEENQYNKINSISSIIGDIIEFLSPVLIIFALTRLSFETLIIFCIITFGLSSLVELFLKEKAVIEKPNEAKGHLIDVVKHLKNSGLVYVISLIIISNVLTNPQEEIFYPQIFSDFYSEDLIYLSIGYSLYAVTSIITGIINIKSSTYVSENRFRNLIIFDVGILLLTGLIMNLHFIGFIILFYILMVLYGIINTLIGISFITLLQTKIDKSIQSIVFGGLNTIVLFFVPLGLIGSSILIDAFSLQTTLLIFGTVGIASVIVSSIILKYSSKTIR